METTKRTYVLTPAGRASARALAARRANLDKARAGLEARGTPDTKKRRDAYLANLKAARAAQRPPGSDPPVPFGTLRHGLYAQLTPEGLARLGEKPSELEAHRQRLAQVFAPADEVEHRLVRGLADNVWRRLRLHRAQACWEADRLCEFLAGAPPATSLSTEETEWRAHALVHVLNDFQRFFDHARRLEAQVERALRKLLRRRSGGAIEFRALSRRDSRELAQLDDGLSVEELLERMQRLEGSDGLRECAPAQARQGR